MKHATTCLIVLGFAGCTQEPRDTSAGRSVPREMQGPTSTSAEEPKGTAPSLTEWVEYYSGGEKRKLWLSKELVAEFEPADSGRDAVLRADPAAVEVEQAQTVVRIRRVRAPSDTDEFARGASSASARLSPVLHEGPSPATPMGALPGGVVATFPKDWDLALVRAWVANLDGQMEPTAVEWWRVRMETEIAPATNMFLLTTPPGLESVRIANELHETGELVEVTPSSWLQAITH